ncbi:class IIb bacteriocin, lactobin A/cerein 7B family [Arsukibacterium sp.]|uniref:class IIb bacteriocin, lactobin A/cerein 7B family n=1 Tax=Arsukibacterium sp. TaxID=1977258 RepID=UPI001BD1EDBA|nr:class IIb bacteriocin, lactobin A/cerein 7B family [Arsukibacterium sp.]
MQELTFEQVEEVNGGILPVAWALVLASPHVVAATKAAAVVAVGWAGMEVGEALVGD